MFKKLSWIIALGFILSDMSYAGEPVRMVGMTRQRIQLSQPQRQGRLLMHAKAKNVVLLKLKVTQETKENMRRRMTQSSDRSPSTGHYTRRIQLGMNNVPVMDQGEHGTCIFFAGTAALDAAMGKGDYISQLCQLDLNQYLNQNGYAERGWYAGWGQDIFSQITMFGIVPKAVQLSGGCAGRTDYPLKNMDIQDELSVFDFHQISEPIQNYGLAFEPLILKEQINAPFLNRDLLLNRIKSILNVGERITCSMFLMGQIPNDDTPSGSYHMTNDTWVLLPQMTEELNNDLLSGHAFVITGYDDDAIAIDATGKFHRGLLTLRNSWGSDVGDHGDFYMSYAYFKAAVLEAHRLRQTF